MDSCVFPGAAVTAGSFAAWTVPQGIDNLGRKIRAREGKPGEPGESPLEGEVYFIVIRSRCRPTAPPTPSPT